MDARGERTIGVLTKPDLIGPGNEDEVLAVLHNVRKPLQLGYVMVKNRWERNGEKREVKSSESDQMIRSGGRSELRVRGRRHTTGQVKNRLGREERGKIRRIGGSGWETA